MSDDRAVHVKLVKIDGKDHFVTVCPPGEEVHDDMVWRFPEPHLTQDYQTYIYNGCTAAA